jgi:prophage antirepressor-like protein
VYAQVKNNKQFEVRDLEVRVLLLDAKDNVFAVGTTLVPFLTREESRQISFTWNKAFEEAPTRILVYPIFSPFQVRE